MSRKAANDRLDDIEILVCQPDENHLAWGVLQRMGATGNSPGSELRIAQIARDRLRYAITLGTVFYNPRFTVIAPGPSRLFFKEVHKARKAWLREMKTWFASSRLLKVVMRHEDIWSDTCSRRELNAARALIRQLENTGILIVDGTHITSERARENVLSHGQSSSMINQSFGRLTVVEQLTRGKCLCRCSCGCLKTIRRQHLRNGSIRSCGCLKEERDERHLNKKHRRGI